MADFNALIQQFSTKCEEKYTDLYGGHAEDQLKPLVGALLEAVGPVVNLGVEWRSEVHANDVDGRPDMGVIANKLLVGHIELKAPDVGARPEHFTGANRKQFQRFRALPNLMYTDGTMWSLYRSGEQVGRVAIAADIRDGEQGILSDKLADFLALLTDFLHWSPITPTSAAALAKFIAPLSKILRVEVSAALGRGNEPIVQLANEWRQTLMPEANDEQFADAYAQTLTYALLLAQFEGAESLNPFVAVPKLQQDHALLAAALQLLEAPVVRDELRMPIELLERAIGAIDETQLEFNSGDWLYFYEVFLAAYDPKLRKDRGVYFTPTEVVGCQVRLAAELLHTRFGKADAFADQAVHVLDPAVGTGTYPLAIIDHAAETIAERYGPGMVAERISDLADRLEAFEILVGPYAVARLRTTQRLHEAGATTKAARVYLADTLTSPNTVEAFSASLLAQAMTDDREAAQQVKSKRNITVCIGNPPYDRGKKGVSGSVEGTGNWVVHGDGTPDETPLIESFTEPVKEAGEGGQLKNLYNSYVYFWRWAMWKVFESPDYQGIVSFITASSYLRGPAFAGMRRVMRETFDELWIIDLEGDNLGARKTDNVFVIESPVAVAIGIRHGASNRGTPAITKKVRLTGTNREKLSALTAITSFASVEWADCSDDWQAPFFPLHNRRYADLPRITDIFPWQHSGSQLKRTWPIGTSPQLLQKRWAQLTSLPTDSRKIAFRETADRKISGRYGPLTGNGDPEPEIASLSTDSAPPPPEVARYQFRSFDRQHIISRLAIGDRMRPELWRAHSSRQVYLTSLLTEVMGSGSAAVAASAIPDLHHFRGSFGGKHAIPLYRDADATQSNVTQGVLDLLGVSAEHLFAYVYGILAQPAYVETFWDELELPPPHVPITKDAEIFAQVAEHGRELIQWHTYGERFVPEGQHFDLNGTARNTKAVSQSEYPNSFSYNDETKTLHVGDGEFGPVESEVYCYSVSGLQVVKSWLGYRMKDRKGRKSSPLDDIRPEVWTFSEELLQLIWVLERTIAMQPTGKALLDQVLASELWTADELPKPTEAERRPPKAQPAATEQLDMPILATRV